MFWMKRDVCTVTCTCLPDTDLCYCNAGTCPHQCSSHFELKCLARSCASPNRLLVGRHSASAIRASYNRRYHAYGRPSATPNEMEYSLLKRLKFNKSGHIELPIQAKLGRGVEALIDHAKDEDKEQLYSLIQSAASKGDGMSTDQFQTEKEIHAFLAVGINFCCKDMDNNGKMIGFVSVYPSPLCRSNVPVMQGGKFHITTMSMSRSCILVTSLLQQCPCHTCW